MSQAAGRGPDAPTLESVAARAGVSRATVSRVVNGSSVVSLGVRRAVEAAIAELGYRPNRAARSLATRRAGSVALIVSEPEELVLADPFLSSMIWAVGRALAGSDFEMVLKMVGNDAERAGLDRFLDGGTVDGVILVSFHDDHPPVRSVAQARFPAVVLGRSLAARDMAYVDADNAGGAARAVRHLAAGGRRRIATIAGPQKMAAGFDRLDGVRRELQGPPLVAFGDFTLQRGQAAMDELLGRAPDLDAVFAASDLMALGAIRALHASGRAVPDDVAVIGFDDAPPARLADPSLTTMRQPLKDMARALVDGLLTQIGGGVAGSPVMLSPELVIRDSA
ncbi:DNA-binding LacI/PurR family transcriptional regulator [Catenulispora sp. GAS73]|uniref:LacI family DNA-binding transcriptional regulator n=1 Tax=Catenulispora sp. GAS73 TaxID=3156269 RepID=UPI0035157E55